jgi:hypothetical protein
LRKEVPDKGIFRQRDPFHTKHRAYRRGHAPNAKRKRHISPRGAHKQLMYMATCQAINAQQQIEFALRASGSSWRELEKIIHNFHKHKWSQIEAACGGLLRVA